MDFFPKHIVKLLMMDCGGSGLRLLSDLAFGDGSMGLFDNRGRERPKGVDQ